MSTLRSFEFFAGKHVAALPVNSVVTERRGNEKTPRFRRIAGMGSWLLILLCVAACSDIQSTAPQSPPLRFLIPSDGTLGDAGITVADTYFVFDVCETGSVDITSNSDPFWDPGTQSYTNIVSVGLAPENHHLEGGYDVYGNTLLDYYANDEGAQNDGVELTHVTNDNVSLYDKNGQPVIDEASQDLIGLTGSLVNSVDPTQVVIPISGGSGCPESRPNCGPPLETSRMVPFAQRVADTANTVDSTVSGARRHENWKRRGDVLEHTYSDDFVADADALGDVDLSPNTNSVIQDPNGQHTLTITTIYKRDAHANAWVLDHADEVTTHKTKGFSMSIKRHLVYAHVRGGINAGREAHRDSVRAQKGKTRPQGVRNALALSPRRSNLSVAAGLLGESDGGGELISGRSTPSPISLRADVLNHPGPASAPAIILQHGIYSSEGTWTSYMEAQLESGFQPSAMLVPSLSSLSSLEYQVEELRERIISSGVSQAPSVVIVGHSQGGLIARRLGQENPGLVSGVITIGSPNLGAPLMNNTENAIAAAIGGAVFGAEVQTCNNHYNARLCSIFQGLMQTVFGNVVHYGLSSIAPATADLRPGSAFLASAAGYESFQRASIAVNARNPWRAMRLMGDARDGCDASGYCAGRRWATTTEVAYKAISGCSFFGSIFSRLRGLGNVCRATKDAMQGAETAIDRIVSNKGPSDGIVPVSSQHYPGNAGAFQAQRFYIDDGDSHVGETRSRWTRDALLNQALIAVTTH